MFLDFIDQCCADYRYAYEAVNEEDKRLQDLLHEIEFAPDWTNMALSNAYLLPSTGLFYPGVSEKAD